MARELTDSEIEMLATEIVDTTANIYTKAKTLFGITEDVVVDDNTFDRLKKLGDIFRCEECSFWLGMCVRDPACITDTCVECSPEE